MTSVVRLLAVAALTLVLADSAFAQTAPTAAEIAAAGKTNLAGIGMGLSLVGAGIGIGLIGFAALSGIARQPEASGKIQGPMILLAALVEGAAIISLILCFLVA